MQKLLIAMAFSLITNTTSAVVLCEGKVAYIQVQPPKTYVMLEGQGFKLVGVNSEDDTKAVMSLLLFAKAAGSEVRLSFIDDTIDCSAHEYATVPYIVRLM